jgi:RNA polymerase II subunit A C-terminal domain phosphatase SSU72
MLSRNAKVKSAPERWQDEKVKQFDIVITYEERVFDAVVEDLEERGSKDYANVHLLGLDVRDNHTDAEVGAQETVQLVQALLDAGEEWEDQLEQVLEAFTRKTGREVMHTISFY